MPGSHCVALCFSDCGHAEYFDSYGLPPYKLETMSYLQNHSTSWTLNRHLTTRFNIKCVRPLLLPLRTPQGQGTVHDVIHEYVYTCSLQVHWYKGCAGVPCSVWRVSRLQALGASAAVVQASSINKGTYTNYCQSKISQWLILPTWKERMVNWWSKSWQLSTFIAAGSLRMCLKDPKVGKICHCLTLD